MYKVIESRPGHRGVRVTTPSLTVQQAVQLATNKLTIVLWINERGEVKRVS
jgi:hypothetical protein